MAAPVLPVVTGAIRRAPVVTKVPEGIKVEDRDGYYRIAKSYAEATTFVQQLASYHNSVMGMNGFEAAKWRKD